MKKITPKTEITLLLNGEKRVVLRRDYVTAKTKQLREFGYPDLTEQETESQLKAILSGGELNVIGKFMQDEIVE